MKAIGKQLLAAVKMMNHRLKLLNENPMKKLVSP